MNTLRQRIELLIDTYGFEAIAYQLVQATHERLAEANQEETEYWTRCHKAACAASGGVQ